MAHTTSLNFPQLFDVARNRVAVAEDSNSIANRTRLLILTEPTELYNEPTFGVGLKRYLWQYNNGNQRAIIKDRIIEQLNLHEPRVDSEKTEVTDGLLFTGGAELSAQEHNQLKLTVALSTVYEEKFELEIDRIEEEIFKGLNV